MITLYSPATNTFVASNGVDQVSDQQMRLNILIELRVLSQIALDGQRGIINDSVQQLRSDIVNDSQNPLK